MNSNERAYDDGTRFRRGVMMAICLLVATAAARAGEPIPIEVVPVRQIQIGAIAPGEQREIGYATPDAAQFVITGKSNRWVVITIAVDDLESQSPTLSEEQSNQLVLTTTGLNCAYSLDDGETWRTFDTDDLIAVLRFPASATPAARLGRILLRIGGTVAASASQQRGPYLGSVVVSAEYGKGSNDESRGSDAILQWYEMEDDDYFTIPENGSEW